MHVAVWCGSECLWRGDAPDAVMGVRPGDELDVPGVPDTPVLTVLRRHVSLRAPEVEGGEPDLMLRLEVSVG